MKGPGHFRDPVQPDREPLRPFGPDGDRFWAGVLGSPAARLQAPRSAAAIDSTSISHVVHANRWESLKSPALALLAATSHELGIVYGVAEGGWGVIEGLLDFLQMIVLEGLYQKIHGAPGTPISPNPLWSGNLFGNAVEHVLHRRLEAAHREFRQLMDELGLVDSLRGIISRCVASVRRDRTIIRRTSAACRLTCGDPAIRKINPASFPAAVVS